MNIDISSGKLELYNGYFKIWFKKGSYSNSTNVGKSGCDGYISINSCDKIEITYELFIDERFDTKGAKIGVGFCSSKYVSGGKYSDGEFSVRFMSRGSDMEGEAYCYMSKNQITDYVDTGKGMSIGRGNFKFIKNEYVNVRIVAELNSLEEYDGSLQVYYNDKLVINEDKVNYRDNISTAINYLYISNFAGGQGEEWVMKENTFVRVRGLKYENYY